MIKINDMQPNPGVMLQEIRQHATGNLKVFSSYSFFLLKGLGQKAISLANSVVNSKISTTGRMYTSFETRLITNFNNVLKLIVQFNHLLHL